MRLSERDLLELHRAKPASDAQIEHYVMAKVYWAWRYGLTNIVFQPFDALRLSTTLEEIDRVAMILDGEYVRVINQLVGPRLYQPLSRLLRDGPNRLPAPQSVDAAATIQPLQEPRLYSLIVTGEAGAWSRPRNGMSRDRFGEHTVETLVSQFKKLDQTSLDRLQRLPAILAYEKVRDLPAHVARLRKVTLGADSEIRFEHEPVPGIAPISPDRLAELAWELDIGRYEMNRTHWAIKDVDLDRVLAEEGLSTGTHGILQPQSSGVSAQPRTLSVAPTVFSIPTSQREPKLVAVMMPFSAEFSPVYDAIRAACESVGLSCTRADEIWSESVIIQDVFELIYRSVVTVVDVTGLNGNVMYETGIAHTLGRPVVPISRSTGPLPFDLAHHRVLNYLPNQQGLDDLRTRLARKLATYVSD
ncbi:MAG: hypothetical protein JO180_10775 [Gemmatirosa sp.]|nr:hypothetical protein [Gemmatirosa sp.]